MRFGSAMRRYALPVSVSVSVSAVWIAAALLLLAEPASAQPANPQRAAQAHAQACMQAHFSGDMGFTPATVARKVGCLSPGLQQDVAAYFARPAPPDEVPAINGDPFTNSQEYPSRFSVGLARVKGERAEVLVRFSGHGRQERLHLLLQREPNGGWRIDDVRYADGSALRALLR